MPRLDAIRQIGVTEQTLYRWKNKRDLVRHWFENNGRVRNGHGSIEETKRLQNWSRLSKRTGISFVRRNNEGLSKSLSDLTLDKLILAEAANGNV